MSCAGLGEYIEFAACPYPEIVDAFNSIPPNTFPQPLGWGLPQFGERCGAGLSGVSGLGLFDSGMDWTQWGFAEWVTVAFGAYVAISLFSDIGRGVRGTRKAVQRVRRRSAA